MAKISMDTEIAGTTVTELRKSHQSLTEALTAVTQSVESLKSSWQGTAQAQFANTWDTWHQAFAQSLERLLPMADGVQHELEELEQADGASNFG